MPRPGISYIEVAQAATKLMAQDIRPSIEEVRKVLGTGSNSTINRYLNEWRTKQGNQLEAQQGLPDNLLIAVKGIYDAIKEEAEHKINAIRSETQDTINTLQLKFSELDKLHNQMSQEKYELENALSQAQEEKSALVRRQHDLEHQLEQKTNENQLLHQRLDDKALEINRLILQLKNAQDNLDHYRESIRQEREAENVRFERAIQKLESEVKSHQSMNTTLKAELAGSLEKIKLFQADNERSHEHLKQSQDQLKRYEHELQAQCIKLNEINQNHQALQQQNNVLITAKSADEKAIQELQRKLEHTAGRLEATMHALKKAEDNLANFSNKNMFLVQEKTELAAQLKQLQNLI